MRPCAYAPQSTPPNCLPTVPPTAQLLSPAPHTHFPVPSSSQAIYSAIEQNITAASKASLLETLLNLNLPESVTTSIALEVYTGELPAQKDATKIITKKAALKLLKLRDLLSLTFEQVELVHVSAWSEAYASAVREVMGTIGPYPDSYWEGLQTLQARLGFGDETVRSIHDEAALEKMKEIGGKVSEALQKKITDASAGVGADFIQGVDDLLEFASNAKVLRSGSREVGGECREFTAVSTSLNGQMEARVLQEVYRQYMAEGFSEKQVCSAPPLPIDWPT